MQVGVDIGSYTFNASAGTITFVGVGLTTIEQIKPIINGSANIDIFNPLTVGKFGTLSGQVLTLDFDTSSQNNSDKLYICVNLVDVELATEATQLLVKDVLDTIKIDTDLISKESTQLLIKAILETIGATLDVDLSTRASEVTLTDILLQQKRIENVLISIFEGQELTNKILKKIYNPE